MGPQDGVDIVVEAADIIVNRLGRDDVAFTIMGSGDCYPDLVAQRDAAGLGDALELPGRVPDEYVAEVLSTADVGLSPDPLNPLNDVSTMNKTMEYMAFGLPVVAFELRETRVSAGLAARYVEPNDVEAYARAILEVLDDPSSREEMGQIGRERVETQLAWEHQRDGYVRVFDDLVGRSSSAGHVAHLAEKGT
jgi:glycosyltransferase involved in cell wall biosynthesis